VSVSPINQLPVVESICGVIPLVPFVPFYPLVPSAPCNDAIHCSSVNTGSSEVVST